MQGIVSVQVLGYMKYSEPFPALHRIKNGEYLPRTSFFAKVEPRLCRIALPQLTLLTQQFNPLAGE